jgi:hypothetical protein
MAEDLSITLDEFSERYFVPLYVECARRELEEWAHFKVTSLIWFNGSYRAAPKFMMSTKEPE